MIPAVLLAAGASTRLGRPKQLLRHGGATLLRRAVEAASPCGEVVVVLGCRAAEMEAELAGTACRIVFNPDWEEGMASSLRAGVRALPAGAEAALFLVCDQPALDRALVERILAAYRGTIVACAYAGVRGIPALLPARTFPALLALRGDTGARALLRGEDVQEVPFPEGAWDVDEPGDLRDGPT